MLHPPFPDMSCLSSSFAQELQLSNQRKRAGRSLLHCAFRRHMLLSEAGFHFFLLTLGLGRSNNFVISLWRQDHGLVSQHLVTRVQNVALMSLRFNRAGIKWLAHASYRHNNFDTFNLHGNVAHDPLRFFDEGEGSAGAAGAGAAGR